MEKLLIIILGLFSFGLALAINIIALKKHSLSKYGVKL